MNRHERRAAASDRRRAIGAIPAEHRVPLENGGVMFCRKVKEEHWHCGWCGKYYSEIEPEVTCECGHVTIQDALRVYESVLEGMLTELGQGTLSKEDEACGADKLEFICSQMTPEQEAQVKTLIARKLAEHDIKKASP